MALPHTSNHPSTAVMDAIYQRRSIRAYSKRLVSKEFIEALIGAAIQAPSAMNQQSWGFYVIQNPSLLRRISNAAKKKILESPAWAKGLEHKQIPIDDPEFNIFYGATTVIVICVRKEKGFCPEGDCYLAAENLMLAAQAMGLATCPIGFARDVLQAEDFSRELEIPKEFLPLLPIAVGYAKEHVEHTVRAPAKMLGWRC